MEKKDKRIKLCKTCGNPLILAKDKIYSAMIGGGVLTAADEYSAIECEICGCQNILSPRYPKKREEVKK